MDAVVIRYRYDEKLRHGVLDVGARTYPVKRWLSEEAFGFKTRQAVIEFENRWGLSIVWSSCTYGDNYHYMGPMPGHREEENQPFVEEPHQVEVGVFSPEPRILPGMDRETVAYFADKYPADPKTVEYMMQDRETALACDPFGWQDAEAVNALADMVMRLPSHPDDIEAIGKELGEWRYG